MRSRYMSAFDRLIEQIDSFIRKFYKNQMIKGLLLFVGVLIPSYILVVSLEYLGRFSTPIRAILFFSFIGVNGWIFTKYFLIPVLRLRSFGKRIDRYQASVIIGRFFPNVSDRLLNTLQLNDALNKDSADYELLSASVIQRSESLKSVPFSEAIDISENKRYVIWLLPVIVFLLFLFWVSPGIFTQGTSRVVNFNKEFPVEAPFRFVLNNTSLEVMEGEDVMIDLVLEGQELPEKVFINSDQGKFLMERSQKNAFQIILPQVRKDTKFYFTTGEFMSDSYQLRVLGKAAVGKLNASIIYPAYLGMENESLENATDLTVPEGSIIEWSVAVKNSKETKVVFGDSILRFSRSGFTFKDKFLYSTSARIELENSFTGDIDSVPLQVEVVKDNFPVIEVTEAQDSLDGGVRYFSGSVSDDHGLNSLRFVYTINRKNGEMIRKTLSVQPTKGLEMPFEFAVDFRREDVQLEDQIDYHFVVSDNDGVNGSKSTKSRSFVYKLPTRDELMEKRKEDQNATNDALKNLIDKANEFKTELKELRKDATDPNKSSWQKENKASELQKEHESIVNELENIQEQLEQSTQDKDQLSEIDEELLKQQDMINDLLEELMDDELKGLLDQLSELLQEQNKDALEENLDDLELSSEEMSKQLERSLEMLKKLQVDERIDDVEDKLKELAEKQEELAEEVKNSNKVSEEQKKAQKEINEEFDKIKVDLNEIDSLNNELDRPMELGDLEELSKPTDESLNKASEQLEKGKENKASEQQQNASDQMEELSEMLDAMQAQSNQQQQEEDIGLLREILESLMTLSFDQEDVMNNMARISDNDPAYLVNGRLQRKIYSDTKIVSDSLEALARRKPKIASFIDEELNQIRSNHELSIEDIDERRRRDLQVHQQYVMTSYNNLALMLNEALQQMQQQMQLMMPGSGSCNKPGGKGMPKPGEGLSPGNMKEMLKKQLEQMQKSKGKGSKPGEGKGEGKKGEGQGQGMGIGSKGLAKMAAEQSAIRKRLEQMRKELNKDGSGKGNQLNPLLKELEKQERDLINKRLDDNVINRQRDILTRLLESEKALMERGLEEKRESKEGKNEDYSNQIQFLEYNKEKLRQLELLRSVDPTYRKYYKDRANEYFNRIL